MPIIQTSRHIFSSYSPFPAAPIRHGGSLGLGFSSHGEVKFSSSSVGRSGSFLGSSSNRARRRSRGGVVRAAAAEKDHYSTLKVSRNASLQEIKTAYKKLALKYHPDLNREPGAEDKFKEISAAYEVLSDGEKRSAYDRFGDEGLQGDYDGPAGGFPEMDPFDVYNTFFGGSDGFFGGSDGFNVNFGSIPKQDLDIQYNLFLSLEESIFGGERDIEVSGFETCETCAGTGAKSSDCVKLCKGCGGRGSSMKTQRTPFGMMSRVSTCSNCGGKGNVVTDYCRTCGGAGKVTSERHMTVVIPPGVNNGSTMRLRGEGNIDKKRGVVGDLFLTIKVSEKRGIQREGLNLYSKINVDYTEAILGAVLKVETVEGVKDLYVPPGIQPGETVKLRRLGVPDVNRPSVRGDHYFTVNVSIPKRLSDGERVLLEKLASFRPSSKANKVGLHRSKGIASVWNTVKDFLGQGRDQQSFSSITFSTSSLTLARKPDSPVQLSILGVVMLTILLMFVQRISKRST